jgi:hypothetical protein
VCVAAGLISEELVYRLWGGSIINAWQEWANTVYRLRVVTHTPQVWIYFQDLSDRMRARLEQEKRTESALRPPSDELEVLTQ